MTIVADSSSCDLEKVRQLQRELLKTFPRRGQTTLQLIEALASTEKPISVVELSQEVAFQRSFSSLHKALDSLKVNRERESSWTGLLSEFLPKSGKEYQLFALDATSNPRPYAHTLEERSYIHKSGQLGSPITIGLQASLLVALPDEKEEEAKWTLPLTVSRIGSNETPYQVAQEQLEELAKLYSCKETLCVITADSGYTRLVSTSSDQVIVARCRVDRTGRRPYRADGVQRGRGRPRKYQGETTRFVDNVAAGDTGGQMQSKSISGSTGVRRSQCG